MTLCDLLKEKIDNIQNSYLIDILPESMINSMIQDYDKMREGCLVKYKQLCPRNFCIDISTKYNLVKRKQK